MPPVFFCGHMGGTGCKFAPMEQNKPSSPERQLHCAVAVTIVGCALLITGFIVAPLGEIHQSVLIGFGECLTFAGALLGIDYRYKQ